MSATKKWKKVLVITASAVVACAAITLLLIIVIIPNVKYNAAMKLYDEEFYDDAYEAFKVMDYKDSKDKEVECLYQSQAHITQTLFDLRKDDIIKFGQYEQDGNVKNGKEEIEWQVLDVKDGKALVVSLYALEAKAYNSPWKDVTWETCTLRKWLNDSFLSTAFGPQHQKFIPAVTVPADANPNYKTNPGNDTNDKVFLLSLKEAETYFPDGYERRCEKSEKVHRLTDDESCHSECWWWLRTPSSRQNEATIVRGYGVTSDFSNLPVCNSYGAVRPAMWIEFKKIYD